MHAEVEVERMQQQKNEFAKRYGVKLDEEESSEDELQVFACDLCNKTFKSEKQWKNHEKSKKHKEKLAKTKSELQLYECAACAEVFKTQKQLWKHNKTQEHLDAGRFGPLE